MRRTSKTTAALLFSLLFAVVVSFTAFTVIVLAEKSDQKPVDKKEVLAYRVNRAFSLMGVVGATAMTLLVAFCLNYFATKEVTVAAGKLMPTIQNKLAAAIASGDKDTLNTTLTALAENLENIEAHIFMSQDNLYIKRSKLLFLIRI